VFIWLSSPHLDVQYDSEKEHTGHWNAKPWLLCVKAYHIITLNKIKATHMWHDTQLQK